MTFTIHLQIAESKSILHPCVSLEWTECSCNNIHIKSGQTKAIYIPDDGRGRLYITTKDRVYFCVPMHAKSLINWHYRDLPPLVCDFTLASFSSKLVLVGGCYFSKVCTNQVYYLDLELEWEELPPMPTRRAHAVAVGYQKHLVVAGGRNDKDLTDVEVYNSDSKQWKTVKPLPEAFVGGLSSVLHDGIWYLIKVADVRSMCSMPIKDLVIDSDTSESPWKLVHSRGPCPLSVTLPPISFGGQLLAVTKNQQQQSYKLCVYSQATDLWISIEDVRTDFSKFSEVVGAVSSGANQELMLIYSGLIGSKLAVTVMKATLKGTHEIVLAYCM